MPIASQKKVQSMIQGGLEGQSDIESGITKMDNIKTNYQNHNPDLTDSNMTAQQVIDWNAYHTALKQTQIDHAAIIATLKAKDMPSHGTKSLD